MTVSRCSVQTLASAGAVTLGASMFAAAITVNNPTTKKILGVAGSLSIAVGTEMYAYGKGKLTRAICCLLPVPFVGYPLNLWADDDVNTRAEVLRIVLSIAGARIIGSEISKHIVLAATSTHTPA